jgi:AcrR family transcriptional regulator
MARTGKAGRRRVAAGAAVLQPEVSLAIRKATLKELARVGYRGMAMESVARRAGVGKAALYRRWPSKREMIAALISDWGADATETPDTGSLAGDVEAFLTSLLQWFEAPLTSRIFPDLVAEAQRDPKLQALLHSGVRDRRRTAAEQILQRGITRGELPQDVDRELALDLIAAPIFWRVIVTQGDTSARYVRSMAAALLRAIDGRRAIHVSARNSRQRT